MPDTTAPDLGLLVLRLAIAWIFLWPLPGLLRDWSTTVQTTALVFPLPRLVSVAGVLVMPLGAVSVGIGVYGRIGGAALAIFCVGGAFVHRALAGQPAALIESLQLEGEARETAATAAQIGAVGHATSALKNWVVAAACLFITLAGTGKLSVLEGAAP